VTTAASSSVEASPTVAVAGTVTDGKVVGATVAAYAVQPGGILGFPRAAAESYPLPAPSPLASVAMGAADNAYRVEVDRQAGPIVIEVMGGTDTDPVDGRSGPLPAGFRLRAAVPDPGVTSAITTSTTTFPTSIRRRTRTGHGFRSPWAATARASTAATSASGTTTSGSA
jgi:hypothetical protein